MYIYLQFPNSSPLDTSVSLILLYITRLSLLLYTILKALLKQISSALTHAFKTKSGNNGFGRYSINIVRYYFSIKKFRVRNIGFQSIY